MTGISLTTSVVLLTIAAGNVYFAMSAAIDGIPIERRAAEDRDYKRTVNTVQLCGYNLLKYIRHICRSNYAVNRRSDPNMRIIGVFGFEFKRRFELGGEMEGDLREGNNLVEDEGEWEESSGEEMWTLRPKDLALQVFGEGKGHLRMRRAIVNECCHNPCSRDQMLKYCGRN